MPNTTPKKIKLSPAAQIVINHMKNGYRLKWESCPVLVKENSLSLPIATKTARSLSDNAIIAQLTSDFHLTELGKSL